MEKSKGVTVVVVQGKQWDNDRLIMMEVMVTLKNCWSEGFIVGGTVRGGFECEMLVTKIPEILQSLVMKG